MMSTLEQIYNNLLRDPSGNSLDGIEVYHSSVYYTWTHLKTLFPEYDLTQQQVAHLMVDEGLSFKGRDVTLEDLITTVAV